MTTLTMTLSTALPSGEEVYQQIQIDQSELEKVPTATSDSLFGAYNTLKSNFAAYVVKQPTA